MIKELIEDITFDKITISQALTRAKIIAYKIGSEDFKNWIISELNGYALIDLPEYRKISCDVFAEVHDPFHGKQLIPFDVSDIENDLKEHSFYKLNATQSILTIEQGLEQDANSRYGYEDIPLPVVQLLKKGASNGDSIVGVKRRIQMSQIKHILALTKQKLLDTLLELNIAFPDMENDFKQTEQNNQKAQTIINNNIYGDNVNSNVALGNNINQSIKSENKIERLIQELKDLGVPEEDLTEVKSIIQTADKQSLGKKMMNWVGKMATKSIEKGIDLQIPLLIEKIHELL
jgi:hypothetical protein